MIKRIVPLLILSTIVALVIFGSRIISNQKDDSTNQSIKMIAATTADLKSIKDVHDLQILRIEGDFYVPKDINDLIAKSDLIVVGRAMQSITESTPLVKRDSEESVTEAISQTKFKVGRVIKGDVSIGDVILVGQQASVIKDIRTSKIFLQVLDEYQPLIKDAKYILFLAKGLNNSSLYFPIGVYFGKLNADGSDGPEDKNRNIKFKALKKFVLQQYKQVVDQSQ